MRTEAWKFITVIKRCIAESWTHANKVSSIQLINLETEKKKNHKSYPGPLHSGSLLGQLLKALAQRGWVIAFWFEPRLQSLCPNSAFPAPAPCTSLQSSPLLMWWPPSRWFQSILKLSLCISQHVVQNGSPMLLLILLIPFLFPVPVCQVCAAQSYGRVNFCIQCEYTEYSLLRAWGCAALQNFRQK